MNNDSQTLGAAVFRRQSDAMLLPDLIEVAPGLIAAVFKLMKLIPAKYVIERAANEGRLDRDAGVVETSSGTFALGLGLVCSELGLPFHIVSDAAIDGKLQRRLVELGGSVDKVTAQPDAAQLQVLRMKALANYRRDNPSVFWPRQYDNSDNRAAYHGFADHLLEQVGRDFTLVGTVGSGSSTCGTIRRLRATSPGIGLVGVDTFGSVLFGLTNGNRTLRGLGNSLQPGNLMHECFDEVHWVNAGDAFFHTRALHRRHGLFMGPTSGAAYQVAQWIAARDPKRPVVFMAADEGHRYAESVYDDEWLQRHGLSAATVPTQHPTEACSVATVGAPWARLRWGRRRLAEVVGEARSSGEGQ